MENFSNEHGDVFLIKVDRMIDRGALMSRYSRTASLDIRDVYKKEFLNNPERGKDFYKKIFLEYGDESVAELTTAQLAVQNISNIATKFIEESRVGLSYLEKSSRYVRYDIKVNGKYLFASAEKIGINGKNAEIYEDHCEFLFKTYSDFYSVLSDLIKEKNPISSFRFSAHDGREVDFDGLDESEKKAALKSYESSVRSAALDEIRSLLPASTLTNLGISGNGRSFISLIQRLKATGIKECLKLADDIYEELHRELPELIDSAKSERSDKLVDYMMQINGHYTPEKRSTSHGVTNLTLISCDSRDQSLDRVISMILYNQSGLYDDIERTVAKMSRSEKEKVISMYAEIRKNRRFKPGRAFEAVNFSFEVITNFGAFRDLQRHRFLGIIRKPLTAEFGYEIPEIINSSPDLRERFVNAMQRSIEVYRSLAKDNPETAQYCVPYAFMYPVVVNANLREITYFTELRSTQQAHLDLRRIANLMYSEVRRTHPELSKIIKFVDGNSYVLGRLKSEMKKETRLKGFQNQGQQNAI
ncbi:FAD-dependent thymidylate synthase [Oxyplasma meridianum]|uniref:FAD-dependent thymidylate synthase n=1 Tax=Oxyplasma meridianum TaxID=3073602 RepID=A0AAX4NF69_9ARCH